MRYRGVQGQTDGRTDRQTEGRIAALLNGLHCTGRRLA